MKKYFIILFIFTLLSSCNYYMNCYIDKLGIDINHVCNDTVYYAIVNGETVFLNREQYNNYLNYVNKNCKR